MKTFIAITIATLFCLTLAQYEAQYIRPKGIPSTWRLIETAINQSVRFLYLFGEIIQFIKIYFLPPFFSLFATKILAEMDEPRRDSTAHGRVWEGNCSTQRRWNILLKSLSNLTHPSFYSQRIFWHHGFCSSWKNPSAKGISSPKGLQIQFSRCQPVLERHPHWELAWT